jgi:C1A family cysteine protease
MGPILTRLNVDAAWMNVGSDGRLDVYDAASASGGHAVALVGYTPDRLIVRNSWGADWGDQGFAYASIAYGLAAFTEAYGVTL